MRLFLAKLRVPGEPIPPPKGRLTEQRTPPPAAVQLEKPAAPPPAAGFRVFRDDQALSSGAQLGCAEN